LLFVFMVARTATVGFEGFNEYPRGVRGGPWFA
jgi:hypothetical protein